MKWNFTKATTKKGTKYWVHVSYRKEGKPTSTNCGYIDNIEEIQKEHPNDFDEFIRSKGQEIFETWEASLGNKHSFTFSEASENEDAYIVNVGQCYLKKLWSTLGMEKLLDNIKPENHMKYKYDLNDVVFYLVSKQILDPTSKLQSFKDQEKFIFNPHLESIDPFYDCLSILAKNADNINLSTYKKASKYLQKSSKLYFYDVTTVNMSKTCPTNEIIGLKKGKEGIFGPLIQVGYLCDEWGLLIGLLVFNGSKNEQSTLEEQIKKIFDSSKLKNIVICTDAGLCSLKNKRYAERVFKGYITTQSLKKKKVPETVRKRALDYKYTVGDEKLTKEQIVEKYESLLEQNRLSEAEAIFNKTFFGSRRYKTKSQLSSENKEIVKSMTMAENSEVKSNSLAKVSEKDLNNIKKGKPLTIEFEQRLVLSFSLKYYYSQLKDLNNDAEKAKNAISNHININGSAKKDFKRFLTTTKTTSEGEIIEEIPTTFLEDVYNYEKSMCGLYCQATNLDDEESVIYSSARERWVIEDSFRTSKSDLNMSKVFLSNIDHIIGHFELCFLAQTLLKVFLYKIYNYLGEENSQIGRLKDNDLSSFTKNNILKELRDLTGMIKRDNDNVACVISTQKKNEINKVFAEVFKFSLTKHVTSLYELTKIK